MVKPDFKYEQQLWENGIEYVIGLDEVGRGCFAGPLVVGAVVFDTSIKGRKSTKSTKGSKTFDTSDTFDTCGTLLALGIDDSKRLKPKEREKLAKEIKKHALAWEITEVGVSVINKIGIGKATEKAMRRAVGNILRSIGWVVGSESGSGGGDRKNLNRTPSRLITRPITNNPPPSIFILTDFFNIPYLRQIGLKNQRGIKKGDQTSISIAAGSIIAKVYRDQLMLGLSKKHKNYGWGRNKGYGSKEHREAILKYGQTRHHRKQFVMTFLEKKAV